jgi:hypothetical protein
MLRSLRSVKTFLEAHVAALGAVVNTGARRNLDAAIAELSSHAAKQTGSYLDAKGSTQRQGALRRVLLRDHMAPIARIAAAELPHTEAMKPLRMPSGRPTAEKLAAAADGMAEIAAKYADVFIEQGLPADFVARLAAAASAVLGVIGDRDQSYSQRKGATTGLKEKLSHGRKVVRILDSFVQTALQDDLPLLAEWNSIKRVRNTPVRAASAESSNSAAVPTPQPTPPTV